eukprot:gene2264-2026_t
MEIEVLKEVKELPVVEEAKVRGHHLLTRLFCYRSVLDKRVQDVRTLALALRKANHESLLRRYFKTFVGYPCRIQLL